MGKLVHNNVLDAALNYLKTNGKKLVVLTAEPDTYAHAVGKVASGSSGLMLASVVISSADYTGPADGDSSGRKIAVNAQSSISIDGISSSASSATHVAIVDSSNSAVLYCTTCTSQSLTAGNKVNTPSWDIEIRDPA